MSGSTGQQPFQVFVNAAARDSAIPYPTLGQHVYLMDTGDVLTWHGTYAGWQLPWNVSWGEQAYTELVANTAELNPTAYANVGLTVTLPLFANRTYRVVFNGPAQSSFEAQQIGVRIIDSAQGGVLTTLFDFVPLIATGPPNAFRLEARVAQGENRTATFTVQAYELGAGVVLIGASAPRCSLAVEDIGSHGPPIVG
jgi:hypothetical protein